MRTRAGAILLTAVIALLGPLAGSSLADGWAGPDPTTNFPTGDLPSDCLGDPTGAACVDAGVSYLDQARASLGQPPYVLPSNFDSLSPEEQALVLTDEDRILYGLPPITGLTDPLSQDAGGGVQADGDPQPSNTDWWAYTTNWGGGWPNMPIAYEEWMYDDGPNSSNLDCAPSTPDGCWIHRHDTLWVFDGTGALAMGAAAGLDPSGTSGFTTLLEQYNPGIQPVYTYTWAQAVTDGASATSIFSPPPPDPAPAPPAAPAPIAHTAAATITIESVHVRRHRVLVRIVAAAAAALRCSLHGKTSRGHGWTRSRACAQQMSFGGVPAGSYRLRVSSSTATMTRRIVVR